MAIKLSYKSLAKISKLILAVLLFFACSQAKAFEAPAILIVNGQNAADTFSVKLEEPDKADERPNPVLEIIKKKRKKNKRITAAILAFPFPFGMVGLHRIYLGTAPHVPVVYIGSLGGIFGILPFIDFCVLVLDKDIERYSGNKKVFMWVN